jgi:hypothetical protein
MDEILNTAYVSEPDEKVQKLIQRVLNGIPLE